jgi:hypothetical protein
VALDVDGLGAGLVGAAGEPRVPGQPLADLAADRRAVHRNGYPFPSNCK